METEITKSGPAQSLIEDEAFWKNHAKLHQASGLTRVEYCRLNNVHYDRFTYWIGKQKNPPSALVAVKLKSANELSTPALLCTLDFKNGYCLKIHDKQALLAILEKLR